MISEARLDPLELLGRLLPAGWEASADGPTTRTDDGRAVLRGPADQLLPVLFEVKGHVWPRDVGGLLRRRDRLDAEPGVRTLLVVAPWLSPRTREVLARERLSYIDAEGSLHLDVTRPAVFIHLEGASRNPSPPPNRLRTLRGRGAGKAIRALTDFALPDRRLGVRELATASGASAATLSRVISLLDQEDLVQLDERRSIQHIDWKGVLRRWARDYPPKGADGVAYLEPRGLSALEQKLAGTERRYACTGSLGVQWRDATVVAPARVATIWVENINAFAAELGLTRAERGGNVVLRRAWDDVVLDRLWSTALTRDEKTLKVAAAAQIAVDLLTGPGRDPAQGEELLKWMHQFGPRWKCAWPEEEDRGDRS